MKLRCIYRATKNIACLPIYKFYQTGYSS